MAADENYRISELNLPDLGTIDPNPVAALNQLIEYLRLLNQAIAERDNELKNKLNQVHVEYVTSAPSDAPNEPEPVFRIYNNAGTYYLYIYINSVWKYVQLT